MEFILIMKTSRQNIRSRISMIGGGGGCREADFYQSDFASQLVPLYVPHCLYSYSSRVFGEYVLLMEDVKQAYGQKVSGRVKNDSASTTIGVNFLYGNQVS